ncbi:MAG: hypothetical protein ACK5MD_01940 [Flavobacteriales bacterium]
MKSFLLKPLLYSGIGLMILFVSHYMLISIIPLEIHFSIVNYYIILMITTISVVFLSLLWFFKKPDQLNAGFLYGSTIKIVVVAGYVFWILDLELKSDKIHVVLLYISSLFIEVFFIGKILNRGIKKK